MWSRHLIMSSITPLDVKHIYRGPSGFSLHPPDLQNGDKPSVLIT